MKLALFFSVIFCSFLLASTEPLPPWLRIYLGLKVIVDHQDTDLVHVIDGSTSVGSVQNFRRAKRAARFLTRAVNLLAPIGSSGSQIGFVQYSSPAKTTSHFHLGQYNTAIINIFRIALVPFHNVPGAAMGKGLKLARKQFINNSSSNNKMVLLVTNTDSYVGIDPKEEASKLKAMGVRVCVMFIGNTFPPVMKEIASGRCYQRYPSYEQYKLAMRTALNQIVRVEA